MAVKTGNHWQKPCLAESKLAFQPVYPAPPGAKLTFFHQFISFFYFIVHIKLQPSQQEVTLIALPSLAGLRKDARTPQRGVLRSAPILARPVSGLGSEAHLRGFGIIYSLEYKRARDYGEVFYTVKTTFSIKNEP